MSGLAELIRELCPDGVERVKIGNIASVIRPSGKVKSLEYLSFGKYPVVDQGQSFISGYTNEEFALPKNEYVVFGDHTCVVKFVDFRFVQGADGLKILVAKDGILPKFLYYCMDSIQIDTDYARHWSKMKENLIPLPPLPVQRRIVLILDTFSKLAQELALELALRKKQYAYYRETLLDFKESCEVKEVRLGDVADILRGSRLTKAELSDSGYPVYHGGPIPLGYYHEANRKAGTTVVVNTGNAGKVFFAEQEFWSSDACFSLYPHKELLDKFLYYCIVQQELLLASKIRSGAMPTIDADAVKSLRIPLPPLPVQKRIVHFLDHFEAVCEDLSIGLPAEIKARQRQYEYYRDLILGFRGTVTADNTHTHTHMKNSF